MRVIGKILSLIVIGILSVILFAMDQVAKVYSLAAVMVYTVLGICLLFAILGKQCNGVIILSIMLVIGILFFMLGIMMTLAENAKSRFMKIFKMYYENF